MSWWIGLRARLKSGISGAQGAQGSLAGFTLVEILMAFAIMAFAFTLLFQTFSTGLLGLSRAEERLRALQYAESVLARIGSDIQLENGSETGQFEDGSEWDVVIDTYEEDGAAISDPLKGRLFGVEVTVRGMGPALTLQSLRIGEAL